MAAFVIVTVGTVLTFSYLLREFSRESDRMAAAARTRNQGSFELVDLMVKVQGLTQQLLSSSDPDAMEALLRQDEAPVKKAPAKVQEIAAGVEGVRGSFAALVAVNQQVQHLLLHARNIEARQMFIEKSNPAFEWLLGSVKRYQDQMAQKLEEDAAQEAAQAYHLQLTIFVVAGISALLLAGLGVALVRSITRSLRRVVEMVRDVAEGEGNLTKRLEIETHDEIGELAEWFNRFMKKLQGTISEVAVNTQRLASASEEISATASEQVRGTESQKEETEQVATAMHEMVSSVKQVSENSNKAAHAAEKAAEVARHGNIVVKETLETMRTIAASVGETAKKVQALGKSSEQIEQIVGVIGDIAEQTNLLALNAAIEAARAGEQGRGFAVVADEVRKLAECTSTATKEIAGMIHRIQAEMQGAVESMKAGAGNVTRGVESTSAAGPSLAEIIQMSQEVSDVTGQIDTAAKQQSIAAEEINARVLQIAKITHQTAVRAHESAKAVQELSSLAFDLQNLVSQFKLASTNGAVERTARPGVVRRQPSRTARARVDAQELEEVVRA